MTIATKLTNFNCSRNPNKTIANKQSVKKQFMWHYQYISN